MSNEDPNITLVRRISHEGTNLPITPTIVQELYAADFICHGPPGVNHSHAGSIASPEHCMLQGAFADVIFHLSDVHSDGDKVSCRFNAHGRQIAEFQGIKPSDREIKLSGSTTFRIENNQVAEAWGVLIWD